MHLLLYGIGVVYSLTSHAYLQELFSGAMSLRPTGSLLSHTFWVLFHLSKISGQ